MIGIKRQLEVWTDGKRVGLSLSLLPDKDNAITTDMSIEEATQLHEYLSMVLKYANRETKCGCVLIPIIREVPDDTK